MSLNFPNSSPIIIQVGSTSYRHTIGLHPKSSHLERGIEGICFTMKDRDTRPSKTAILMAVQTMTGLGQETLKQRGGVVEYDAVKDVSTFLLEPDTPAT